MIDFLDLVTFMCTLYKLKVQEYELFTTKWNNFNGDCSNSHELYRFLRILKYFKGEYQFYIFHAKLFFFYTKLIWNQPDSLSNGVISSLTKKYHSSFKSLLHKEFHIIFSCNNIYFQYFPENQDSGAKGDKGHQIYGESTNLYNMDLKGI